MKLGDRIDAAGISRATYYNRISRGMSPNEALSTPKGKRATGMTLNAAIVNAKRMALLRRGRPPSHAAFTKMKATGVPGALAVLAGRPAVSQAEELLDHVQFVAEDANTIVQLVRDLAYVASLRALYRNIAALTGEQVKTILMNLTERVADKEETDECP